MGCAHSRAAGVVVEGGAPSGRVEQNDNSEPRPVPSTAKTVGDDAASWRRPTNDTVDETVPGRLPSAVSDDSAEGEDETPSSSEVKPAVSKKASFAALAHDSTDQTADRVKKPPPTAKKIATKRTARAVANPGGGSAATLYRRSSSVLEEVNKDRNEEGDFTAKVVHIELPGGKPIEAVYDGVHTGRILGAGVSGEVRLVIHRSTGVRYAVKRLDLSKIETEDGLRQLREEICIMCQLDHPNIVRLEEVYEDEGRDMIYLVQELCTGTELFDRLDEQAECGEGRCADLVRQMLSAVRFLHSKGIVHRDLKAENFLFSDESLDADLRMIDFGLSKHFTTGQAEHEAVGTPYTVAPEVIRGCYDERCDLWAVGVIAFFLLCGETPFGGCSDDDDDPRDSPHKIRENILACNYSFDPPEIWDEVSDQGKDFIRSLLVLDPTKRLNAEEAQKSPWLLEFGHRRSSSGDLQGDDAELLNAAVVEALLEFREYTDMQKLLCEVLSFTLLPFQIEPMRREFRKLDGDGLGEISLSDFKDAVSRLEVQQQRRQHAHAPPMPSCSSSFGAAKAGRRRSSSSSFRRPPLTEDEIHGVFDAMRRHRAEARIHWHEFVAAGLRLCDVDERNIRLAFDRLDSDHTGYISFDNILYLSGEGRRCGGSGCSASDDEEATQRVSADKMRRQWGDLTSMCRRSPSGRITYEDFRLLMDKPNIIRCGGAGAAADPQVVLLAAGLGVRDQIVRA